jgi:hypothetical protein
METTEKIVEAYVRYVHRWATILNIRCAGQNEIDLLAINPLNLKRYHIEISVSASKGFSRLTAKPFIPGDLKIRVKIAGARRTIGIFEIENSLHRVSFRDCASTDLTRGNTKRLL